MTQDTIVDRLLAYLVDIVRTKRQPPAVGEAILRRFHVETLAAAGQAAADDLDDAALEARWLEHFWDPQRQEFTIDYMPVPSPYDVVPCYAHLLRGLGYFKALRYESSAQGLSTWSQQGKLCERNTHLVAHGRHPLQIIAQADPVLRNHSMVVDGGNGTVTLTFQLDESQIAALHDAYKALPVGDRGYAGTNDDLRQAIVSL